MFKYQHLVSQQCLLRSESFFYRNTKLINVGILHCIAFFYIHLHFYKTYLLEINLHRNHFFQLPVKYKKGVTLNTTRKLRDRFAHFPLLRTQQDVFLEEAYVSLPKTRTCFFFSCLNLSFIESEKYSCMQVVFINTYIR